jgi:catechol 2,3-dioxygenase-like lactoylglutathione lyase family enzyme
VVPFSKVTPRLPVVDLRETIEFYTRTLGFRVGLIWPDDRPIFAILDRDDVSVQFDVAEASRAQGVGNATLCFEVGDVRAAHAELKDRVPVEWGPEVYWYGRREFAVRDPSGYLIIFTEPTDDPPTCEDES